KSILAAIGIRLQAPPCVPRFSISLIPADIPGSFWEFSFPCLTRRLRQAPPRQPSLMGRGAIRDGKGNESSVEKFPLIPHIAKDFTPRSSFAGKTLISFTFTMIWRAVGLTPVLSTLARIRPPRRSAPDAHTRQTTATCVPPHRAPQSARVK